MDFMLSLMPCNPPPPWHVRKVSDTDELIIQIETSDHKVGIVGKPGTIAAFADSLSNAVAGYRLLTGIFSTPQTGDKTE